jgi:hypothetical protein
MKASQLQIGDAIEIPGKGSVIARKVKTVDGSGLGHDESISQHILVNDTYHFGMDAEIERGSICMTEGHSKVTDPCLKKAADNEPVFVLRAQDKSTPKHILMWLADNEWNLDDERVRECFESVMAARHWPYRKQAD